MMYMNFLMLLQAAEQSSSKGGSMMMWLIIILCIVVMWFFMIRPQRKQQKELQKFRDGLKKGDKIVTVGGIYGTVVEVRDQTLIVEIDSNVKIKVAKNSVVRDSSDAEQQQQQQK